MLLQSMLVVWLLALNPERDQLRHSMQINMVQIYVINPNQEQFLVLAMRQLMLRWTCLHPSQNSQFFTCKPLKIQAESLLSVAKTATAFIIACCFLHVDFNRLCAPVQHGTAI